MSLGLKKIRKKKKREKKSGQIMGKKIKMPELREIETLG
jgi:hypothetical protein